MVTVYDEDELKKASEERDILKAKLEGENRGPRFP